ncbi:MAG: hypothetical protein ABJE95_23335 [Byssovorax sp.]
MLALAAGCAPLSPPSTAKAGDADRSRVALSRAREAALPATAANHPSGWHSAKEPRYARHVDRARGFDDWTAALQAAIDDLPAGEAIPASTCADGCGATLPSPACAAGCALPATPGTPLDFSGTLFLPAGTYSITRPLRVRTPWIRIIGEDPRTTTIVWRGPRYDPTADRSSAPEGAYSEAESGSGRVDCLSEPDPAFPPAPPNVCPNNCTHVTLDAGGYPTGRSWMIWIDDASAFELSRLTLDGQGTAEVALRVAATNHVFPATPPPAGGSGAGRWLDFYGRYRASGSATGYSFSDLVIEDTARGLWAGVLWRDGAGRGTGAMDSEGDLRRVSFLRIGRSLTDVRPKSPPRDADTSANVYRAAVRTSTQNTMNWNVWESTFTDCDAGLLDGSGAGGLNVWSSLFVRSRVADVAIAGSYFNVIRGNTSVQSRKLVTEGGFAPGTEPGSAELGDQPNQDFWASTARRGGSSWTHLTIEDNVVLDPGSTAIDVRTMEAAILDNVFRTMKTPIAEPSGFGYRDGIDRVGNRVLLVGNRFPEALARPSLSPSAYPDSYPGRAWWTLYGTHGRTAGAPPVPSPAALIDAENSAVSPALLASLGLPRMPETPRAVAGQTVLEVAPSYVTATDVERLSSAITTLCAGDRGPSILHLLAGVFFVDHTLLIPPGCEIQIVGDGKSTRIEWGTATPQLAGGSPGHDAAVDGAIFRLLAPARATIRDLRLGAHAYDTRARRALTRDLNAHPEDPVGQGIVIELHDEPGDQVYLEKVYAFASENPWPGRDDFTRALVAVGAHVDVRVEGSGFGNAAIAVDVDGAGAVSGGVRLQGCNSGGNALSSYRVQGGGRLVAEGVEQESTAGIDLRGGSGSFTFVGARYGASIPVFWDGETDTARANPLKAAWWGAFRDHSTTGNPQGWSSLHAGDFRGTLTLIGVDVGLPILREATRDDLTFLFGLRYAYSGNRRSRCNEALDPGLWPSGLAPSRNPEPAAACRPAFQINGGTSYISASVMTGTPLPLGEGCATAPFTAGEHGCEPPAENHFVPAMLADLRRARVGPSAVVPRQTNTDAHLARVSFASWDSRAGILLQKVP